VVFVLGTDEAGYGPNLGPLVIAASAWQIPDTSCAETLYELLAEVVTREPDDDSDRLAIADSKRLYKPGALDALERGVLTALTLIDRRAAHWRDIWRLAAGCQCQIDTLPWHDGFDEPLPTCRQPLDFQEMAAAVHAGCTSRGVRLADLQAAVVFPAEFNTAVSRCDNKAEVLSLTTLRLAGRILQGLPPGPAIVFCDKHGGRNRYAALLQEVFPEQLVLVRQEGAELSTYRVQVTGRLVEFRFQPKGEQHLPTALASMTAKYLRELAMRPFNAFWQRHVPGLKATAGYPGDARRFFNEIRAAKERLGISDQVLWRER
jgi:hypothetical protein